MILSLGFDPCDIASSFHQHDVTPATVKASNAFSYSNTPEAVGSMERQTGDILLKDTRLQRPNPGKLRRPNQFGQECGANLLAAGRSSYINANLGDAAINVSGGDRAQSGPPQYFRVAASHQTSYLEVTALPFLPVGRGSLEGSVRCRHSFFVNRPNGQPVRCYHWCDRNEDRIWLCDGLIGHRFGSRGNFDDRATLIV